MRLFIDRQVVDNPLTTEIRARLKVPAVVVDGAAQVYRQVRSASDPIDAGKHTLFLTRNQGAFVRRCPGTREYICCGYQILHIGTFCTMDCAYCILQAYFHPPVLQLFVNRQQMRAELGGLFAATGISRIGTGEFTDSLIWQRWTDLAGCLVTEFSGQRRAVLELKTKTVAIEKLRGLSHNRKTIMAWSLNTPRVIAAEERGTAPLDARLAAARQCQEWGYPLAFHFDPMLIYKNCGEEYKLVVDQLFKTVSADRVVWISLGTFRFMPALKGIVAQRFSGSNMIYGEFINGMDGKQRYFKPLRIQLYRAVIAAIRAAAPQVTVYFCMEDETVWRQTLGYAPAERGGLARILDESAMRHCDLDGHAGGDCPPLPRAENVGPR